MPMSAFRNFWSDERGATMVEFALVSLLFLMTLLAIGEFGLANWAKASVADAAREGTRWAMVRGGKSGRPVGAAQIQTYVRSRSSLRPITVTTVWTPNNLPGSTVAVTVSYAYKRTGLIIPNKTLSSTSKMVIVY
ncbi:MAG TPA: TadE family protein [Gemmatimonadaceae bacterium]|nr:TadE family protein [Gemmatimonadaceae bacterium]